MTSADPYFYLSWCDRNTRCKFITFGCFNSLKYKSFIYIYIYMNPLDLIHDTLTIGDGSLVYCPV